MLQDAAKAIVVSDFLNRHNYQYLLDESKWVKLNTFPKTEGKICGIFENNNTLSVCVNNCNLYTLPSNRMYRNCTSYKFGNNIFAALKSNFHNNVEFKHLNTNDNKWVDCNVKTDRDFFSAVQFFDKVWIVGGLKLGAYGTSKVLNSTELYDHENKTVVTSPITMMQARRNHKAVVYNGKLFVFGGIGKTNKALNTVEMYSPGVTR